MKVSTHKYNSLFYDSSPLILTDASAVLSHSRNHYPLAIPEPHNILVKVVVK